jgi:hypothetical protein
MSSAIQGLQMIMGSFSRNFSEHEEILSLRLSNRARFSFKSSFVSYKLFDEVVAKVVQQVVAVAVQQYGFSFFKFHF